jgi:hypothetical protein
VTVVMISQLQEFNLSSLWFTCYESKIKYDYYHNRLWRPIGL